MYTSTGDWLHKFWHIHKWLVFGSNKEWTADSYHATLTDTMLSEKKKILAQKKAYYMIPFF